MDPRDQIVELLDRAAGLPEGPTQIAVCEEAVRLADAARDDEAQFHARKKLTQAAVFGGSPDVAMVSFAWCLARSDADPEAFPEAELLWQYKWLVENGPFFVRIPRAQIGALFSDMARRFAAHGSNLHPAYQMRRDVAKTMGDLDLARVMDAKFRTVKPDRLSNCAACVLDGTVEYHIALGDDEAAVKAAKPALAGRVVCGEVPHRTHAYVLLPLLRLGKPDAAADSHRAGYRLTRDNPKFVGHNGLHLAYLALTGQYGKAAKLVSRHLPEATATPADAWRFDFYAAARLLVDRVTAAGVDPDVKLPDAVGSPDGPERWPTLGAWLVAELDTLSAAFDARNGNDWYAVQRGRWRELAATRGFQNPDR